MFVIILKISTIFQLYCYSAGAAAYKRTHTSIFIDVDETVMLNCTCFLQSESSWAGPKRSAMKERGDNDTVEPYTEGLLLNPGLLDMNIDIIGNYDIGECNLVIRNFSAVDVGNYQCEYLISGVVYIHIISVYLKSPPTNLTFLNIIEIQDKNVIRGIEGKQLDIVCIVNSGKPLETLSLTKNGAIVQRNASGEIEYSFIPSRNDNLKSFDCSAYSEMLEVPLINKAILDIRYKPTLTVYHPALENVIENTSIEVCCKGKSNPPLDDINWTGRLNSLVARDNESCMTFNPILRTHTGRYKCVASNSIGTSHTHIDIIVKYPPVVSVLYKIKGQATYLHCHPNGEPKHYTFAQWFHRSEFNENIRQIQGTQNGKLSIIAQSKNKLHENNGIYVCRVSNGIKDKNGMLYQEGLVFVQREAPPIFIPSNRRVQLGQYGCELDITAFLYNKFDNIQLNLSNQNKVLHPRITHGGVRAHDLFHGVNVTVSAIKLVFHLGLASENDFANYSIEACNTKGCNTYTVDIRSASRPETPENLKVDPYETYMVVSWSRGFNGGYNQLFFIQYRTDDTEEWTTAGPVNDILEKELKYTLYDMISNTQYHVCMFSRNTIGDSNTTNVTVTNTLDFIEDVYGINPIKIAVPTMVVVILFISTAVILYLRKKAKDSIAHSSSYEEDVGENTQGESVENQLYQTAEFHINTQPLQTTHNQTEMPLNSSHSELMNMHLLNEVSSSGQNESNDSSDLDLISSRMPICETSLNYAEIVFEPGPSRQQDVIRGIEDKTVYSDIDLLTTATVKLSSSDTSSDDDFMYVDGIENYSEKRERNQF